MSRYSGGEAPTLHRLGGADWAKAKGRARKAVRQIASELIRLYSARMASPGYGKTEIAVRAAFQAVQDGKQVAVLAWRGDVIRSVLADPAG